MIIDMRLRPPLKSWKGTAQFTEGTGYYPSRMGMPRPPSVKSQSVDDLLKEMKEADILGVIMGRQAPRPLGIIPNDEITEVMQQHPGRFVAFTGIDLRDIEAGLKEIERTRRIEGYRGVSIEPGASFTPMYPDDKTLYPIYERCQELDLPVSITISGMLCTMVGNDLAYGSPTPVAKVAKDFPKLKIVISHGAWPSVMPMIEVAFMRENVYVSPDLYINGIDTPGSQEYIKAAKSFMPGRLLFGTAYPSRPLKESVDAFRQWDLSPELQDRILYRNAARLLKLE
ncbi:MAG: amidohydrolase [Betaproteobacteria bacterium]|nr:amidohydrolase [Betaproteobacteria bacterium]MBI3056590.1 amidohydrolase [Betaproteobacteria bacterium]